MNECQNTQSENRRNGIRSSANCVNHTSVWQRLHCKADLLQRSLEGGKNELNELLQQTHTAAAEVWEALN